MTAAAPTPGPITLSPESLKAFAGTFWLESNLVRKLVVDKDKPVKVTEPAQVACGLGAS